ncbi:unnamed protein product [Protopolystoma xenopodis]|uniref:Uncharacterized protein n=1 Tax=Protopolystoma xenopodis TaxID=117903 RepID=A0A3S5CE22_9PLAT|nr:unnamed protein product [Protopolystoma xenopodis]
MRLTSDPHVDVNGCRGFKGKAGQALKFQTDWLVTCFTSCSLFHSDRILSLLPIPSSVSNLSDERETCNRTLRTSET